MRYEQWDLRRPADPAAAAEMERAGIPPLCAAVLCARGLDTMEKAGAFLAHGPELLHDPFLLRDMDKAAARVERALADGERIAVYGDYDVDGITATALLTEFLQARGGDVVSYIPDRIEEGYGLNEQAALRLREQGVSLIVTVDCGITAEAEVAFAGSLGLDVVVTDHHHCKTGLPAAAAVVDPRRPDDSYPFTELAGVGVALKLALAMTPRQERAAVLDRASDLAAVGTIADVMSLTDENRAIVTLGLEKLSRTDRPGLRALLREVSPDKPALSAMAVSYGLAPRINAAGRMEQAEVALELLLTRDPVRGRELAAALCELNRERQGIELNIFETCTALLEADPALTSPCIILSGEGWHQGVIGIVASRLSERWSCPVFMISLDRGRGKASCRSYGGFHLFRALDKCADLLDEYGGHGQAAGFTIREEDIPAFTRRMTSLVEEYTSGEPMPASLDIDAELAGPALLTEEQVTALDLLEPFGAGNPKPVFCLRGATAVSCADVGGGRHLKLKVRQDGAVFGTIFFSANTASAGIAAGDRVDIAFSPQINEFRGRRELQLQLCDLRPSVHPEQDLLDRFWSGDALTAHEAASLLPEREDFAHLWRWLLRECAAGAAPGPLEELARSAVRAAPARRSYGRTMVCFRVLDERGLIRVEHSERRVRVTVHTPAQKVDLEQSELMIRLRRYLT